MSVSILPSAGKSEKTEMSHSKMLIFSSSALLVHSAEGPAMDLYYIVVRELTGKGRPSSKAPQHHEIGFVHLELMG